MLWKIGFVGARIFHCEYSILSSRLCQEKIRHSDKKILGIKENSMQEQENLEEKKNMVLDLKNSLKNLESKHEEFTRLMAQRSLEFQQLEGKNLEQYQIELASYSQTFKFLPSSWE